MASWDAIFKRKGKVFTKAQEDFPALARVFRKEGARKILDLGCGTGRHAVYLASKGFSVCAAEVSVEGLRQTMAWLKKRKLKAGFKRFSVYGRFPFQSSFFDAVVSTQVIQHGRIGMIRGAISEISRVVRPGGLVFISVPRMWGRPSWKLRKIGERTFVNMTGDEKGVTHYFFDRETLKREIGKRFSIIEMHKERKGHHLCVLARKRET